MIVKVEWLGNKKNNLPKSSSYITVAKFDNNWQKDAWSIVLEFDIPPIKQGNPSTGYASFLMPSAPQEKLASGNIFELYEGSNPTAKVTII